MSYRNNQWFHISVSDLCSKSKLNKSSISKNENDTMSSDW